MAASKESSDMSHMCGLKEIVDRRLRVVEFFSGVGGLHCAVKGSGIPCSVVAAVEINTVANAVYRHNFPEVSLLQRNLEGFTVDDFTSFNADMFVMSPPCQPFTRVGLQGDKNDPRTNAFFNILRKLQKMPKKPSYILIENVKGFETSETRNFLVDTLKRCNYNFQEFLLSPTDIGIPNQRVRFFLLAKQSPLQFKSECGGHLLKHLVNVHASQAGVDRCSEQTKLDTNDQSMVSPKCSGKSNADCALLGTLVNSWNAEKECIGLSNEPERQHVKHQLADSMGSCTEEMSMEVCKSLSNNIVDKDGSSTTGRNLSKPTSCRVGVLTEDHESGQQASQGTMHRAKVADYLQTGLNEESMAQYLIPDKILVKYGAMMDIVTAQDTKTCCFTKAYAHYVEGTGSVLRTDLSTEMSEAFSGDCSDNEEKLQKLRALKLRYFTPRELANLHHFPAEFNFPELTTKKQLYRLLGNSLNVTLVAQLIHYLVM